MKRPLVVAVIGYIIGIIIGLYFKFSIVLFYINIIPIGVVIHFINKRKKRKFRLFSIRRYFRYIKIYLNHKIILGNGKSASESRISQAVPPIIV